MANLTKKALRIEMWAMLSDEAKRSMIGIKQPYLNSMMADAESYAYGVLLSYIKSEYGCSNVEAIEPDKSGLCVTFKKGKPMKFKSLNDFVDFIKSEQNS